MSERISALTMPMVAVPSRPNGLPMATTMSPTLSSSELPSGTNGRSGASILRSATSVPMSRPTSRASNTRPSPSATMMVVASATTWLLVTIRPRPASTITPEPPALNGSRGALGGDGPSRRSLLAGLISTVR